MEALGLTGPVAALWLQEFAAAVCVAAFLYLWRQSQAIRFGLWGAAFALRGAAAACGFLPWSATSPGGMALRAALEMGFIILLVISARQAFDGASKARRLALWWMLAVPATSVIVLLIGGRAKPGTYQAAHAAALGFAYACNFTSLPRRRGAGARALRYVFLGLAVLPVPRLALAIGLNSAGGGVAAGTYPAIHLIVGAALECLAALAAMAMWVDAQTDQLREIHSELGRTRSQRERELDLDRLTGLLNQTALARRLEQGPLFTGVVAVCDMDSFKDVNDRYGHLAGDEALRGIGHLLRASIRHSDEAFRWGGDEFVILFHGQPEDVARRRMSEIENRLKDFRQRGLGALPISFSWGTAEAEGRPLREALDTADRAMYTKKKERGAAGC